MLPFTWVGQVMSCERLDSNTKSQRRFERRDETTREAEESSVFLCNALVDRGIHTRAISVEPLLAVTSTEQRLIFTFHDGLAAKAALYLGHGCLVFFLGRHYRLAFKTY